MIAKTPFQSFGMVPNETFSLRSEWVSLVLHVSIYGEDRELDAPYGGWSVKDLRSELLCRVFNLARVARHVGRAAAVPPMLADVPELAQAWANGYENGAPVDEDDYEAALLRAYGLADPLEEEGGDWENYVPSEFGLDAEDVDPDAIPF